MIKRIAHGASANSYTAYGLLENFAHRFSQHLDDVAATRSAAAESTEDLSAPEHIRTWVNDSQFSRETKRF